LQHTAKDNYFAPHLRLIIQQAVLALQRATKFSMLCRVFKGLIVAVLPGSVQIVHSQFRFAISLCGIRPKNTYFVHFQRSSSTKFQIP